MTSGAEPKETQPGKRTRQVSWFVALYQICMGLPLPEMYVSLSQLHLRILS